MLPILNKAEYFFKIITKNTGLFLLFIFFFGCNNPNSDHTSSLNYNKVLDSASHAYDASHTEQAIHYLDSATKNYQDITPDQWFRYYTYHYNYYYFIYDYKDTAMLYADSMLNLFNTPEKKLKYPKVLFHLFR